MADGPSIETYTTNPNSLNGASAPAADQNVAQSGSGKGALIAIGLSLVVAGVAFAVFRGAVARRKADPTTERIQQLIDEANRLLKQLDEKQPG